MWACAEILNFTVQLLHGFGGPPNYSLTHLLLPAVTSCDQVWPSFWVTSCSITKVNLWKALLDDRIDVIATDHAPHTLEEKSNVYTTAPSGGPLVQHAVIALLEKVKEGVISIEKLVEKMSHNPAKLFKVEKRGFIKEGFYADIVLIDSNEKWTVAKDNILYKCGWSPFEGTEFSNKITHTFVNGNLMYNNGVFDEVTKGKRLLFDN